MSDPDLNTVRLAKALTTMSAEWDVTIEELLEDLDNEADDSQATMMVLREVPGVWPALRV